MNDYDKQKYMDLISDCEDDMAKMPRLIQEYNSRHADDTYESRLQKFKKLFEEGNVTSRDYQSMLMTCAIIEARAIGAT